MMTRQDKLNLKLKIACKDGDIKAINALLESGADPTAYDVNDGSTAFHSAALYNRTKVVKLLLEKGVGIHVQTLVTGRTALHDAALHNHTEMVKLLLARGAYVDARTSDGSTALHKAASHNNIKTLKLLLKNGANINARTSDGSTALHEAASRNHIKAIELLSDNGADIHAQTSDGSTALHKAASRNHIEAIKLLSDNGASIDVQTRDGSTALHKAASHNHIEAIKLLLESGVDINLQNDAGHTALSLVKGKGDHPTQHENFDAIRLLETAQFADDIYNTNQDKKYILPSNLSAIDQDLVKARIKNAILTNQPDLEKSINTIKAIKVMPEVSQEIIAECLKIHPEINNGLISRDLDQNPELVATLETISDLPLSRHGSFAVPHQFQEEMKDDSSRNAFIEELDLGTEQFIIPEIDLGQGESNTALIGDNAYNPEDAQGI